MELAQKSHSKHARAKQINENRVRENNTSGNYTVTMLYTLSMCTLIFNVAI